MKGGVENSALVEAAKNYEHINCDKGEDHRFYQINQLCLVDKCPYQLEPLCQLDIEQKLYGNHSHVTRGLKTTLVQIAEMCVKNQIKYQSEDLLDPVELERLFLIAKDFRKIALSAQNLSDYLMEIVNGTHGAKGLETLLWDIFLCKKEDELGELLKLLRKHVRENRGEMVMRDYKNPKNIIEKVNQKKQQIEDEIANLAQALKMEVQTLKARGEQLKKPRNSKEFFNSEEEFAKAQQRSQKSSELSADPRTRMPRSVDFMKAMLYGKKIKEIDTNVFEGSGGKIDMIYTTKPFNKGVHEFSMKLEKFNKKQGHLYIILLQEETKDQGGNFFSPYHCIFCHDGFDMIAAPQKTSNFGPMIYEGSTITATVDMEGNKFQIKDNGSTITYTSNTQLYGDAWRFAIWWSNNYARIRIL